MNLSNRIGGRGCGEMLFAVALTLVANQVSHAGLVNGNFSSPLSVGWTDYDVATVSGGIGVLGEDPVNWAFLEQNFTIPNASTSLTFEYQPLFDAGGQESFTASLLDPGTLDPVVPTDADPSDASETYFFMHDWDASLGVDDILTDPVYSSTSDLGSGWTKVTLDLTSLSGTTPALLAFDFVPGFSDGNLDSLIGLDNVMLTQGGSVPIPVPSAVMLTLLGLGAVRRLRRRLD